MIAAKVLLNLPSLDQVMYHGNRVMKDNKDDRAYVKSFKNIFDQMAAYIKKYHTTGLSWNAKVRTYGITTRKEVI